MLTGMRISKFKMAFFDPIMAAAPSVSGHSAGSQPKGPGKGDGGKRQQGMGEPTDTTRMGSRDCSRTSRCLKSVANFRAKVVFPAPIFPSSVRYPGRDEFLISINDLTDTIAILQIFMAE